MMKKIFTTLVLVSCMLTSASNAEVIVSYDYNSSLGTDPTAQGWAKTTGYTGTSAYVGGYDTSVWNGAQPADVGGFRVVDLSASHYIFYRTGLSEQQVSNLNNGWTATWTFALDKDVWGLDGTSKLDGDATYDDYYASSSNQVSGGIEIETEHFCCYLWASHDGNGNVVITNQKDGSTYTLSDSGDLYYTMRTVSLNYDGTDLEMIYNGTSYSLDSTTRGYNYAGFGSFSGPNRSSLVYDELIVETIPEPTTIAILGLGALAVCRRRCA